MRLLAKIAINGINPYVLISSAIAESLSPGSRKPIPVLIRVNGKPELFWHINMVPKGDGDFYLYLHNDVRKASGTKVGDAVEVEILFDKEYENGPQHSMPEKLSRFITENKYASSYWDGLPPSTQKEILRYLANIKSDAALNRNIDKIIQILRGDSIHHMGRDWN